MKNKIKTGLLFGVITLVGLTSQAGGNCKVEICTAPNGHRYCCSHENSMNQAGSISFQLVMDPTAEPPAPHAPKGFHCVEQGASEQSGMDGSEFKTKVKIELGVGPGKKDITTIVLPEGALEFEGAYLQTKSSFYRWGYSDFYDSDLQGAGHLHVNVEQAGPYFNPNSTDEFQVRGISAWLQLHNTDEKGISVKPLPMNCRFLKSDSYSHNY